MFRHAVSTPRVVCAVLVMFFFSACGGGGGGGDGDSTFAIEPDPVHTGDDCGCGGKTAAGSGMTFSTRQTLFPSIRKNEYVPGEVLVKFREGTSQSSADRIVNRIGSRGARSLFSHRKGAASRLKKVRLRDDKPVERAIEEYVAHPEVEYAEPNYIYHATATTPNDPNYAMLWGLNNTAQQVNGVTGTSGKDIGVETAWDTLTDCGGVVVAVLDTGINYNHRDLLGNMWDGGASYPNHGYDCVDDDNDPMDLNGHGTHCAGIIGANGNDGTGLTGVCWRVKLMAVRVLDAAGSGTLADIAEGIDFAVANGAHVINASLGGPNSATMQTAVANARTGGVIIVAAAGNDGTTSTTSAYPAAYTNDNIISVAAVDQAGDLASFSNYGTTWVDIAAPGVNILSTWPGQTVVTTESFQDWIMGHGWGTGTYVYNTASGPISIDMLTNPSPFGGAYVYEPDLASMAYNRFDLNAYNAVSAIASFYADINVEEDYDYLLFVINENGGVPNMYIEEYTGDFGGMYFMGEYDFTVILNKTISLGFYLETDYSNNRKGAGIAWFDMARLYHNTAACMYSDGTSMAAPHVTGVVAMCVQRYLNAHGSYSRADNYSAMINAVLGGASAYTSLNGKVASGRMLNAPGALAAVP